MPNVIPATPNNGFFAPVTQRVSYPTIIPGLPGEGLPGNSLVLPGGMICSEQCQPWKPRQVEKPSVQPLSPAAQPLRSNCQLWPGFSDGPRCSPGFGGSASRFFLPACRKLTHRSIGGPKARRVRGPCRDVRADRQPRTPLPVVHAPRAHARPRGRSPGWPLPPGRGPASVRLLFRAGAAAAPRAGG